MSGRRGKRPDKADLARQAVEYLVQHDFVLKWDYDTTDPPSPAIRDLFAPYFSDGEIERTTSELLANYLVSRLREDYLPTEGRRSRPAACRVVWGDDD